MNCHDFATLVSAYADDEIDPLRGFAVRRHLQRCAGCKAEHERVLALRDRVSREVPYFEATPGLWARARAIAQSASAQGRAPRHPRVRFGGMGDRAPRLVAAGALAGCAATVLAWMLGTTMVAWRDNEQFATAAVRSHVQAALNDHAIDVASSDRHTVKPWLSARLDYSPPVVDLATEGFPLLGGRVDKLDRESVATLVYRYGQHTIDVYVRPLSWHVPFPAQRTIRGFNVMHADGATMEWFVVSDAEPEVLSRFVQRLARDDKAQ